MKEGADYEVVWSGKMPLLPDREERVDSRISSLPTFEDDEVATPPKPRYNKKTSRRYSMDGTRVRRSK